MSDSAESRALGARPHLDERPTYEPLARQEWFIVTRLAQAIPAAINAHAKPLEASGKALDVGCGRQPFRRTLESRGFRYVGLDTQQNVDNTVAHVCAIDADLPPALLAESPFDFILCTEVMEHVADWPAAFANFNRLLAPGGRLLITCPHFYPLHEEPYDFWRATPHALRSFAARFGFTIIEQAQIGDGLDVLGTAMAATKLRVPDGSWNPLAHLVVLALQIKKAAWVWFCKQRFARSLVKAQTKLYLSNLIVLERSR